MLLLVFKKYLCVCLVIEIHGILGFSFCKFFFLKFTTVKNTDLLDLLNTNKSFLFKKKSDYDINKWLQSTT